MLKMKRDSGLPGTMKLPAALWILSIMCCLAFATPLLAGVQQADAGRATAESPRNSLNEAIDRARQKIAADPSSEKAQVELGNLLLKNGDLAEAAKAFDQALALNARYHDAMTGKGIVLARMGKEQEAEEMLQKALVLNPNPVRTHYELGLLYEKRGDFDKAIAEYKQGLEKYNQGRN